MTRDYKKEYAEYHSKPEQKKNRAKRNKAHRNSNCGPGQEVDHKVPLSSGGSNSPSNWRVVSKETNRKKGSKKMSSFDRLRLAIEEKTAAPEGVERLPSGDIKYRDETFPGYNKPKAAPKGSKHKKRVLAKKGDKVKVVNFGARGYKHNYSAKAKKSYLARSAGIKGKDDKFSANYWSRRELWPKNQKADGSAKKKASAKFDAAAYYASLSPEQRQSMQDAVTAKMLPITKEYNSSIAPISEKIQDAISPYQEELNAIHAKYNPRYQEALLSGYAEGGASDEYLDYLKNQQPNFSYMGKIASADDNFNTSAVEAFMSSASNV